MDLKYLKYKKKYLKYKKKYLKYKQKYIKLKEKITDPLYIIHVKQPKFGQNFNDDFIKDVQKGIMKLEFSHDLLKDDKLRIIL